MNIIFKFAVSFYSLTILCSARQFVIFFGALFKWAEPLHSCTYFPQCGFRVRHVLDRWTIWNSKYCSKYCICDMEFYTVRTLFWAVILCAYIGLMYNLKTYCVCFSGCFSSCLFCVECGIDPICIDMSLGNKYVHTVFFVCKLTSTYAGWLSKQNCVYQHKASVVFTV